MRKCDLEKKLKTDMTAEDYMMNFLDEDDFAEKYEILENMEGTEGITDIIIDNMASSLDFVIKEGSIESRFEELKQCVRTRAKYETLRLRK